MRVTVTSRHVEITDLLKEYAVEKAERLGRYFDHLRKIEVILGREGPSQFSAEVIASAVRGQVLVCHTAKPTAMGAFDAAVDKMERQLTRYKEKLGERPARAGARAKRFNGRRAEPAAEERAGDLWW
jgi:putative sigma-54 modulation protein